METLKKQLSQMAFSVPCAKRQMSLTLQAVIALNVGLKADEAFPTLSPWFLDAFRISHSLPCHCHGISVRPPRTTTTQMANPPTRFHVELFPISRGMAKTPATTSTTSNMLDFNHQIDIRAEFSPFEWRIKSSSHRTWRPLTSYVLTSSPLGNAPTQFRYTVDFPFIEPVSDVVSMYIKFKFRNIPQLVPVSI